MVIYAQHGFGKSDKIHTSLRNGHIAGIVLRPLNEKPDLIQPFVADLYAEFGQDLQVLFDPQFYLANRAGIKDGHLPSYPYYSPGLKMANFIATSDIRSYAKETISFQEYLNLNRWVSPTVYVDDFNDKWYPFSLQLAQESIAVQSAKKTRVPLLISIVVDEHALLNRPALDEFLDIITTWEAQGFYIVVSHRNTTYPSSPTAEVLASEMYLAYVLSTVHGYEVVFGYCDFTAILLHAVGIQASATGWFQTLRQFSIDRFVPTEARKRPVVRYTSMKLISSVRLYPELDAIMKCGALDRVLSGTSYERLLNTRTWEDWSEQVSQLHHWEALSNLAKRVSSHSSVELNLAFLEKQLRAASAIYRDLIATGVVFNVASGPAHLDVWTEAIRIFRKDVKLPSD